MRKLVNSTLVVTGLLLSACASEQPPSKGDLMLAQGAEYARIGENWNKGQNMITEGNVLLLEGKKDIKKGESLVSKGEDKVKKARKMIKNGESLKQEAEEAFDRE